MALLETYHGFFSFFILPDISSGFQCCFSFSMMHSLNPGTLSIFDHCSRRYISFLLAYIFAYTALYPLGTLLSSYEIVFGLRPSVFAMARMLYPLLFNISISERSPEDK